MYIAQFCGQERLQNVEAVHFDASDGRDILEFGHDEVASTINVCGLLTGIVRGVLCNLDSSLFGGKCLDSWLERWCAGWSLRSCWYGGR